jgi:hypothetical protein
LVENGKWEGGGGPAVGVGTHVPTQYSLDTAHCFLEEEDKEKGVFFL